MMRKINFSKTSLYKNKGYNCIPLLSKDIFLSKDKSKEVVRLILDIKREGSK